MKEKMICGVLFLFLFVLTGTPAVHAEPDFKRVSDQEVGDNSDPSAFEGDSSSVEGERAPENLPMSDAPVAEGVGVEQGGGNASN